MKNIKFEIVTPDRIVYKKEIIQITAPTKEGEITILPGHIPLVASLLPGVIEIVKEDKNREIISVSGGFIEVLKDKVVILADTAERAMEIDIDKADAARKRAQETMKTTRHFDTKRFADINAKIAKELARSKAVRRWQKLINK